MHVFVAGATGVLGKALLPQLQAAGHTVAGLARTPENLLFVDQMGAKAVRGDVLDAARMQAIFASEKPHAVVNLATAIPRKLRVDLKDWQPNDRVRTEGTANLLRAAEAAGGVRLFVQESVGYVCPSQGDQWIEETTPRSEHPFLQATITMEKAVASAPVPYTLLRFAALTASDAWHTQQSVAALRRGWLPVLGDGQAYISLIHAEDAARAIVCALAAPQSAQGQIFNVTDDSPARMGEVLPYAAQLLKAPVPRHVSPLMAKMIVGALTVDVLTASYRMTNTKIKHTLGFEPRYPTYRENWMQIARELTGKEIIPSEDLKS